MKNGISLIASASDCIGQARLSPNWLVVAIADRAHQSLFLEAIGQRGAFAG